MDMRMKLAILSRNGKLYSTRRLVEAARERGHSLRVLDPLRCYMRISNDGFEMRYKGAHIAGYHAVVPRIGASVTRYGCAVRATSCVATSCWRRRASACR